MMQFEAIENEGEWQVWTPDITGACIGTGATREAALEDCMDTLRQAVEDMSGVIEGPRISAAMRYQHIGHWTAFFTALLSHWGDPISAADYADDALEELLAHIPQLKQPATEDINPIESQQ